jgi:hypothetical protein
MIQKPVMIKVVCTTLRNGVTNLLEFGKIYFLDFNTFWQDIDGDVYSLVYNDAARTSLVGQFKISHFQF